MAPPGTNTSPLTSLLSRLDALDLNSPEATCVVNESLPSFASRLEKNDAQKFIDELDLRLDSATMGTDFFRRFLRSLKDICSSKMLVPSHYMLFENHLRQEPLAIARGGFSDVFEGEYKGTRVAIKSLRISKKDNERVTKAFCKEAVVWKRLNHENVAYLLGVLVSPSKLYMISEWMENGNIEQYLKDHPRADRLQLTFDVAKGLEFLHSADIVHADLKSANVLINKSHRACLTDFGLTWIISDPATYKVAMSDLGICGSFHWMAPELLEGVDKDKGDSDSPYILLSPKSDIYAFAMVVIEIFTGDVPFPGHNIYIHHRKLAEGTRPARPPGTVLSDGIWGLVRTCWQEDRNKRPDTSDVVIKLQKLVPRLSLV